ncbi:MAG: flavodoxin family protein [Proteobacteria bacterium]|nr:flavodoxin family protein [Pseudomonadota bacterium]
MSHPPEPRKGMPSPKLPEVEFKRRFLAQYADPAFAPLSQELDRIAAAAWDGYSNGRKSPRTRKAGQGFADPDYDLAVDWLNARAAIVTAQAQHADPAGPARFLLINASSRSEHTCPGEMSKSYRLTQLAREVIAREADAHIEELDLSRLAAEYGRRILPCKACYSTAAALCHWPCSCYPNYSLGQTQDWMNDIYPLWVAAHGVMIITPVNWYQVSSPLKLMMDRLVCADGGNTDPTSTHGKDAQTAKKLELAGWPYRRHLKGRQFAVVVHGDAEGAEGVRRSLSDWLTSMELTAAACLDRYIGYWRPYATSHEELDRDVAVQEEVRNAARALVEAVHAGRSGKQVVPGADLQPPRDK